MGATKIKLNVILRPIIQQTGWSFPVMNLVYITFGNNTQNHLQAAFSIYSFLAYPGVSTVNVITDRPAYYKHLGDRVRVLELDEAEVKDWSGPYHFKWRIKIKGIEKIALLYPGSPVVYLDTDTFLYKDLSVLEESLRQGRALMHEVEDLLSAGNTKTKKRMWQELQGKTVAGVAMQATDLMWNAGVVAFPNDKGGEEVRLMVALCDEMLGMVSRNALVEQYACSLSLTHVYGLVPAEGMIGHYWSNKGEWGKAISEFFHAAYFHGYTPEEIMATIRTFPFDSIPVVKKQKSTKDRLYRLVDKLFPPRQVKYTG